MNPPSVPDLGPVLATVSGRIARVRGQGIGEQDTKAALIVPVLKALGWDTEDLEDVKLEYRLKPTHNPVDYALLLRREARLFIEAKALGARLDDEKWAAQLLNYAVLAGVEWVALTDGDAWRLYNSHATVPVEEKLFRTIRVSDPATAPEATLALLAKERLAERDIDRVWKAEVIDRRVYDALHRLFGTAPDPWLVRRLKALAPGLTAGDVRGSLSRLRVAIDVPPVSPETIVPTTSATTVATPETTIDGTRSVGTSSFPIPRMSTDQLCTEAGLELPVVHAVGQRSPETGLLGAGEMVSGRGVGHTCRDRGVATAQALAEVETEELTDLAHGGTGAWLRHCPRTGGSSEPRCRTAMPSRHHRDGLTGVTGHLRNG